MVSVEEGVDFGTAGEGGRDLLCDVYRPPPSNDNAGVRIGVLVLYGGGWVGGEIKAPAVTKTCEALAAAGYVAVGSEYRLSGPQGEAWWPAHIHDVKAAARWMRASAAALRIDPNAIGCVGYSAGAHLALILAGTTAASYPELEGTGGHAAVSSAVQACVAVFPPTMISRGHAGSDKVARGLSKHFVENIMEPNVTDRDIATASPLTHARAGFPPTCFSESPTAFACHRSSPCQCTHR
jgi:acetyl esterase/lipase